MKSTMLGHAIVPRDKTVSSDQPEGNSGTYFEPQVVFHLITRRDAMGSHSLQLPGTYEAPSFQVHGRYQELIQSPSSTSSTTISRIIRIPSMVKGFLSSAAIEKAQAHAFFIYNLSLETLEICV